MVLVRDSAEFKRLIIALADDIGSAHMHWRLFKDLVSAIEERPLVHIQSRTFWHLTLSAHVETALQCLCRAFDQQPSSLHLRSWLATIQSNLDLFGEQELRERLQANPFVDSLVANTPRPDPVQLVEDLARCSSSDPLVKKLTRLRNNRVAHRGARLVVDGRQQELEGSLRDDEFETLMGRANEILNRYSRLFAAETHSMRMIGQDDYRAIFRFVDEAVQAGRQESEALRYRLQTIKDELDVPPSGQV